MEQWKKLMRKVLNHGEERRDRTGAGTFALFGESVTFDNRHSFPAVTTKKLAFRQVCNELACFLRGYDNLEQFHEMGCRIWDGNGNAPYWQENPLRRREGDLGRIYGAQWRGFRGVVDSGYGLKVKVVDQLKRLVDGMRAEPHGRRHVVTALNPAEQGQMCLPPCHVMFQAFVSEGDLCDIHYRVDLAVYMRSVDLFLGLPFDIASYAVLQRLLAKELGHESGYLTFFLGDTHIYKNHVDQVHEVLSRDPRNPPQLRLADEASLFDFLPEHAELVGYDPHPAIAAPMNV